MTPEQKFSGSLHSITSSVEVQMDKYDEAIEFLRGVEPGSYFDECAELMDDLLADAGAQCRVPRDFRAS